MGKRIHMNRRGQITVAQPGADQSASLHRPIIDAAEAAERLDNATAIAHKMQLKADELLQENQDLSEMNQKLSALVQDLTLKLAAAQAKIQSLLSRPAVSTAVEEDAGSDDEPDEAPELDESDDADEDENVEDENFADEDSEEPELDDSSDDVDEDSEDEPDDLDEDDLDQ